ncbi:lysine N(6)-hydroxylase/L-ornithine N(5)-oxygenase family protein [Primorskyibacter sp. 2E107]|uniref:lysine N(6)-hydroxylase/L-ornithine N(5)-oxygenase family protein n=1 Tax=Primorskyibacter sp. 2E107 TaxID=3403458 RepID=UPI003AF99904
MMDGALPLIQDRIYDVIGVGFGPSNIALAIALEEQGRLENAVFLEAAPEASWHPDMALAGADIQHNPLRDFVTPRNPQSIYGFLSYLKAKGRLLDFLNLEAPFPPRSEYLGYVKWVAAQFNHAVRYDSAVTALTREVIDGIDLIRVVAGGREYLARNVSIGTGRSANIPAVFAPHMGHRVVHLTDYLSHAKAWMEEGVKHVTVVGGSQSGVEIILDLLGRSPSVQITSMTRSFGFKQKDLSPFTEAIYLPEFVDYFYNASIEKQQKMTAELWRSNYGAADHDVIEQLDMIMYEQKVTGVERLTLCANTLIEDISRTAEGRLRITARDAYSEERRSQLTDAIVVATGFRNFGSGDGREAYHPLMRGLSQACAYRSDGGVDVARDYSLKFADHAPAVPGQEPPKVFLNGLCEATHGFGDAGSFSLLWLRSTVITEALAGAVPCAAPAFAPFEKEEA